MAEQSLSIKELASHYETCKEKLADFTSFKESQKGVVSIGSRIEIHGAYQRRSFLLDGFVQEYIQENYQEILEIALHHFVEELAKASMALKQSTEKITINRSYRK